MKSHQCCSLQYKYIIRFTWDPKNIIDSESKPEILRKYISHLHKYKNIKNQIEIEKSVN